jgi:hypothetical protein
MFGGICRRSRQSAPPVLKKLIKTDRLIGHALKAAFEFVGYVQARGREHVHGPIVVEQVDDEGAPEGVIDAFVREKVARVEKVGGAPDWAVSRSKCTRAILRPVAGSMAHGISSADGRGRECASPESWRSGGPTMQFYCCMI